MEHRYRYRTTRPRQPADSASPRNYPKNSGIFAWFLFHLFIRC